MPLVKWEERLESTKHLYQVYARLIAELTNNSLEDDALQAAMALLEEDQATLEQIVTCLEGLFEENVMVLSLGCRFFV